MIVASPAGSVVVGQDRAVAALTAALRTDRLAHGMLFVGPDGVGRERTARALARGLLCELRGTSAEVVPFGCASCRACRRVDSGSHPDLHVVMSEAEGVARGIAQADSGKTRPSADIKIDAVRELGQRLLQRPYEGKASVAIIVDAHRMNEKAQNALLKVLEEPAPTTVLLLLVPGVRAVLPTIASRCLRLMFSPLDESALRTILRGLQVADADARAARLGASSMPAVLEGDVGAETVVAPAVERLLAGLLLRTRQEGLGERLQIAEALGRDRLEVEGVLRAAERQLAATLRRRGGVPAGAGVLDEVVALEGIARARADLRSNGAVQLVVERLLCGAPPSILERH